MKPSSYFLRTFSRLYQRMRSRAGRIVIAYAAFASLWIVFSDHFLGWALPEPDSILKWSIIKGVGFVAITSLLLLLLIRNAFGAMEAGYIVLQNQQVEIERLNRLFAARSHLNQAIVRMPSRDQLCQEVCSVLVQDGGFDLAWIGWNDPETHRLMPVAISGEDNNYVANINIYSDDRPGGRGPSGRAFREGICHISNDLENDPNARPWRTEIIRRGLKASAAFPIRQDGRVVAVLNVYSSSRGFFRNREISLLEEVAVDVSFALDNLIREQERQRAELRAGNELLFSTAMIESMPGVIYFYDDKGRFLRWNKNFEVISGYSADEIQEMHPLDFFPPEEREIVRSRIEEVFSMGESFVEAYLLAKDGHRTLYFFTGRHIELDGKDCLVGMGIDITSRKNAEIALRNSEHRYRTLLDSCLESCQLIGRDKRYLYLNDAAAIHNRRPNHELLGKTMMDAWPGIEATKIYEIIDRCLIDGKATQEEVEFEFADGSKGWFDMRVQPSEEGAMLLAIERTERRQAEQALHQLNQNLETLIAKRTAELQTALVRAEAADRTKSAFLATMSHELRTPLNSILGFTGIMLQGLAGPITPVQKKQLGMVKGSGQHLLDLINDVLDISKIEAGQLKVRSDSFQLTETIEHVTGVVKPLAEVKGLKLITRVDAPLPDLISDKRRIRQILLNLLNNGIKFTEKGTITLTVSRMDAWRKTPDTPAVTAIRFAVADTGIGIDPEELPRLFQPFRQIDSGLTRQHEGTGLGLAICKRLATLLGGDISVQSTPREGSVFTLVIPVVNGSTL